MVQSSEIGGSTTCLLLTQTRHVPDPVWRLTIWVPEEQAPLPQSALPSSWRSGRSRSAHSASLAGYPGGQVINSGEECPQDRGRVRLVISDDQIDGRRLTFQWTNGDRP